MNKKRQQIVLKMFKSTWVNSIIGCKQFLHKLLYAQSLIDEKIKNKFMSEHLAKLDEVVLETIYLRTHQKLLDKQNRKRNILKKLL
jgi:hypothetical protein